MSKQSKPTVPAVHAKPIQRKHAAGIDIGATSIYVAVPVDRDPQPVRSFKTFTEDLHRLADWLQRCRIKTVAMESTGVFWVPLFQILEQRGFEVCLVNAHHVKNVPGRKTDVSDCQWLQYLHSVGLLQASFRPSQQVCALRSLLRHRDSLVQTASAYAQRIQKALDQMNLQLHHVISDITGVSGVAILEAILNGERDPLKLAGLRDYRIKASEETVAKSLVGDYRPEHLFTLGQSLDAWRYHRKLIAECDDEIQRHLAHFDSKADPKEKPLPRPRKVSSSKVYSSQPNYDLRTEHYRILGVDLTEIPGINTLLVHTLLAEVGPDLSKFRSAAAFASWLGLCPDNRISGGKILSVRTRHVQNRAALALRIAAHTLHHNQSSLGHYYRRMRAKLGAPKAITATAHKLARVLYHLVITGQPYQESIFAERETQHQQRTLITLHARAHTLGYQLIPLTASTGSVP
jgi:transposase